MQCLKCQNECENEERKQEIPTTTTRDINSNFFIKIERLMPYIAYMNTFECVTIISATTLVTYAHGTHSTLKLGDLVEITFIDKQTRMCQVFKIDKKLDIIWLKLKDLTFKMRYPTTSLLNTGQLYYQIGFSSLNQSDDPLSIANGVISCKSLDENWHIRGTSSSNFGDSGGGCFDRFSGDLLAINVGCVVDGRTSLDQLSSKHMAKAHLVPATLLVNSGSEQMSI